jgi:predicted ATPase
VLRAAVDRAVAGPTPQLIPISGQPGIGKSALGRQLQAMGASRAPFAAGKLDQYQLAVPYAAFAQALQMLVRDILAKSEEVVAHWRAALKDAMGPNGQLIINLAPEIELIVGKQAPVPELQPQEVRNRFQSLFRSVLAVFAGREHPLILLLDDLQWAGPATIDPLVDVLTSHELTNLLVVGAYREDVPGAGSLTRAAEAIRRAGGLVKELRLSPLSISDVGRLVSDALHSETARVGTLAEVLHTKTAGNPFFAVQFLRRTSSRSSGSR